MINIKDLSYALKKARRQNKLSANDVCYLCAQYGYPIYFKTLYKWENAQSMPDLESLEILCRIYNVRLSDILKNKNSKKYNLSLKESVFIQNIRINKKFKKILLLLTDYKGGTI